MIRRSRREVLVIGLALAAVALGGCGKKGPIVAPERRAPVPPSGLRASVEEGTIVVSWSNPRTRADGSRLRDLALVRLFRRDEVPDAPPKPAMLSGDRVVGYQEIARIALDAAAPAGVQLQGEGVSVTDSSGLSFGRRYVYVVTAEDALGRSSPPSERLVVTFLAAPTAPSSPTAQPGDKEVRLTWSAPGSFIDGSPVTDELHYIVLRAAGDGALARVTPAPIAVTSFTDTGLENETTYRYAVRGRARGSGRNRTGPRVGGGRRHAGGHDATLAAHGARRHPCGGKREAGVECEPGGGRRALRGVPRRRSGRLHPDRHPTADHHAVYGSRRAVRPDVPLRRHRAGPRPESERERAL